MDSYHFYPNRTICDVLEEIRSCNKTHNYSYLAGLVEEAQSLANRMESALSDAKSIKELREMKSKLKAEIRALKKEKEALNAKA